MLKVWRFSAGNKMALAVTGQASVKTGWVARLLQYHGGIGSNDILLGYPIVTTVITDAEAAKLTRNTYAECVQQIFADCDSAILTKVPEGFSLLTGNISAPSIVSPRWYVTTDWL